MAPILHEREDGTVLTIKLAIYPKGDIVELQARASDDWQVLTRPLKRKHMDALARGAEVYLSAGRGAVT